MKKNSGNMTIQDIEKACKKLGGTLFPPDDDIYNEPPSICFLHQSVKTRN